MLALCHYVLDSGLHFKVIKLPMHPGQVAEPVNRRSWGVIKALTAIRTPPSITPPPEKTTKKTTLKLPTAFQAVIAKPLA